MLATGARHSYFGMDEWEMTAPGLKKIADATHIRERVLLAFERAEIAGDPDERRRLLTFVVVGGGPTGVEMAGAVAELARHALAADFRAINPRDARVVLVEGGPRVLAAFPPDLSEKARAAARAAGGARSASARRCSAATRDGVTVGGERIACRTVIWAAGVIASPAAKWLDAAHDRAGRIMVTPQLTVPGQPERLRDRRHGRAGRREWPPGARHRARRQADGRLCRPRDRRTDLRGGAVQRPFRYRHQGNLATIGRKAAVADLGWIKLSGFPAWVLWALAHVWFLIGWRNRFVVALNWMWSYVTFERGARLITGRRPGEPTRCAAVPARSLRTPGPA